MQFFLALTIEECIARLQAKKEARVKIVTPNQTVRVGSTAQFPRVDPDKKPEMQVYRAFLEGFDGGRKSFKVGFMY
jgi:hypothetical protein